MNSTAVLSSDTSLAPPAAPGAWRVVDNDGALLGFVVIDRIVAGRSCGGIRAHPAVTAQELVRIARVMTLKCAYAGLAVGGAKGGVILPAGFSAAQRLQRLLAFGRAAAPLLRSGVWSHGADMGTTERDIAVIRHAAGLGAMPAAASAAGAPRAAEFSSGRIAGLTTALAAEAALAARGMEVPSARIAVQGAGAVGRAAARALAEAGARIVAISTRAGALAAEEGLDLRSVFERLDQSPDESVEGMAPPEALFDVACDALLLCAGSDALGGDSADRVAAPIIVCGANIPFDDEVAARLDSRGITVVPDFVAGAGGVLGSTLASAAGASVDEVEQMLRRHFTVLLARTFERAFKRGTTVAVEARRRAELVIAACESLYGNEQSPSLLADRLVPAASWPMRLALAAERIVRGSPRPERVTRPLHLAALARAEKIMSAAMSIGFDA
jgi:glutamate dehydrogenase (NAD(P)+)